MDAMKIKYEGLISIRQYLWTRESAFFYTSKWFCLKAIITLYQFG
jgi:hypothetical protein